MVLAPTFVKYHVLAHRMCASLAEAELQTSVERLKPTFPAIHVSHLNGSSWPKADSRGAAKIDGVGGNRLPVH